MAGCVMCKVGLAAMALMAAVGGATALIDDAPKPAVPASTPAQTTPETKPETKPAATPESKPESKPATTDTPKEAAKVDPYVLGFTVKDIDGNDVNLETYKGKVVLIVNVASKCGMTPQYEGLQKLYEENKDDGLVILGFPANNFGGQEPGSDSQIKEFCSTTYQVTFPMFSKISVKDDKAAGDAHPLFKKLISQPSPIGGAPEWNFTKYLVDKTGNVVEKFPFRTPPSDATLRRRIDELLAAK